MNDLLKEFYKTDSSDHRGWPGVNPQQTNFMIKFVFWTLKKPGPLKKRSASSMTLGVRVNCQFVP